MRGSQLSIGLTCSWNLQAPAGGWRVRLVGDQGHATQTQQSNNRERVVWAILSRYEMNSCRRACDWSHTEMILGTITGSSDGTKTWRLI